VTTGSPKWTFFYGMRQYTPDFMVDGAGTPTSYRIISDYLGSPRVVVSMGTTPAVMQRVDYDEWGNATAVTGSGLQALGWQPFGFTGGILDPDSGFVRLGARDYDPQVGRWTSKDGIGFRGGNNFYAYVNNDPINFVDPQGNDAATVIGILLGSSGAAAVLGHPLTVLAAVAIAVPAVAATSRDGSASATSIQDPTPPAPGVPWPASGPPPGPASPDTPAPGTGAGEQCDAPPKSGRRCPFIAASIGPGVCMYNCPSGIRSTPKPAANSNGCPKFIYE